MAFTEFIKSDTFALLKFVIWLVITICLSILVITRSFIKKFNAPTDKIDKWILELEQQRTNLLEGEVRDVSKQIKKGQQLNKERVEQIINKLYKTIKDNKDDEKPQK